MTSSPQRTQKFERAKKHVPRRTLDELFTETEISDLLSIARLRICKAFDWTTELRDGRQRGTLNNQIKFIGHRPSDLVDHVVEKVVSQSWVVHRNRLPSVVVGDNPYVLRETARAAERELVTMVVNNMINHGVLRYDDSGIPYWEIQVSAMDEYKSNKAMAKKLEARTRREKRHGGGRLAIVH